MFTKIKKILFSKTVSIVFCLILSTGMVVGAFVYRASKANGYAYTENGTFAFAGKISEITVCCNGLKIKVDDPLGGTFMFTASSVLYSWYNLTNGQCVMGDATPFGVCIKIDSEPYPCMDEDVVDGTMRMIGTTLTGPESGTCESS